MRIGVSLASAHSVGDRDPREGARRMIARARAAREAGLDSLFIGDHHVTPSAYYQNVPMLGRLLAEWGASPAGALFLLPLWHPVLLAEQVGTLAALAEGPFVLQCGLGHGEEQFQGMGVSARQRPSRFEQCLAIARALWAGETVTHRGHWTLDGARLALRPPQPVPVWIGATAPPAIERAARLGDGWIAAPALPPQAARAQLQLYCEACEKSGRPVGTRVIRREIYVGASAAEAERAVAPLLEGGHRGFAPEALVYGDAAGVARALLEFAQMGYEEVLVRSLVPNPQVALDSLGRLGEVRAQLEGA